jgi:hypothetical protein
MNPIILKHKAASGHVYEATFLPDKGMNMISFRLDDIEVIDQSTRDLFEERFAGLGALIGPHFHHRKAEIIPLIKDESLFPHIARLKAKGVKEPFSHGIARYAPWQAKATESKVNAVLTGKDLWNGVLLAELEGQNFKMVFEAQLGENGLSIDLSAISDTDSLVGIHYYYHVPQGKGTVTSRVQNTMIVQGQLKPIPDYWIDSQQTFRYAFEQPADFTFHPFPNPLEGQITLDTENYKLVTTYTCMDQENSWQLYHPEGSSFVCIEPISSQDPRHPNLTVSSLHINLQIHGKQ